MITRIAKLLLLAGLALFYTLVVFDNLTDPNSNYQFVRHVLSMDTTFPGNNGMWRAMPSPAWHWVFYVSIIAWEIAYRDPVVVGGRRFDACPSTDDGRIQRRKASVGDRARAFAADVAGCISFSGRRVVFDVAVADMERAGGCLPELCCRGTCAPAFVAAGHRTAAVKASAGKRNCLFSPQGIPRNAGGNICEIDVGDPGMDRIRRRSQVKDCDEDHDHDGDNAYNGDQV